MLKPIRLATVVLLASLSASTSVTGAPAPPYRFIVLDGDTVLVDGSHIRMAGFDAPELGPWAECWAEAALAGHARLHLEGLLGDRDGRAWRLSDVSAADARGMRTARLTDEAGYDIEEEMTVFGYAAKTNGSWDWCGADADLHSVRHDEAPPHGPSLWWPTGPMYDARAAD